MSISQLCLGRLDNDSTDLITGFSNAQSGICTRLRVVQVGRFSWTGIINLVYRACIEESPFVLEGRSLRSVACSILNIGWTQSRLEWTYASQE